MFFSFIELQVFLVVLFAGFFPCCVVVTVLGPCMQVIVLMNLPRYGTVSRY